MRLRTTFRIPLLLTVLAVAGLALATPASAGSPTRTTPAPSAVLNLRGGLTVLDLDRGTAGVLRANGLSVKAIAGASGFPPLFAFPITGGRIDTKTAAGTIKHRGGLRFTAGEVSLGVEDFIIDTDAGVLTARVSGTRTRIPLLTLDTSDADISGVGRLLVVSNVRAALTGEAAAALNATFEVELFTAGLPIGVTRSFARG